MVEGLRRVTAFGMGIYPVSGFSKVMLLIIIITMSAIMVKQWIQSEGSLQNRVYAFIID